MKAQPREEGEQRCNATSATEFVLLGLLKHTKVHTVFLAMILLASVTAFSGNALLMFLILMDSSLHTPMYFFLRQLAFMDMGPSLIVIPKMSMDFLILGNTISLALCGTQIFLLLMMGGAEGLLLAVMSYDRYVAICSPFQYPILMNRKMCMSLATAVWVCATVNASIHTAYTMHLPYCSSKVIDHFFCEVPTLLKLSCSDTSIYETLVFMSSIVLLLIPFSIILASYTCILSTVLSMKSARGQQKALTTCSSHLTVVGLYYGATLFMYIRPNTYHSPEQDKMVAVFYTVVTPVLNPIIYSLRNRDVLGALRKLPEKCRILPQN